jgi:phospholipid/cholesterol/gamma-HCH transport system ATP-binding protein
MLSGTPILELAMAVVDPRLDLARNVPLSLRLLPGDSALIEVAGSISIAAFADLCSGLVTPQSGYVRFIGRDWRELPDDYADASRGRIGRVFGNGAWVPFLDVETGILLPSLHHTRRARRDLRRDALGLAHEFGLPGLPIDRPADVAPDDLDRAALIRAFLGDPLLVLVEDRLDISLGRSAGVLNRVAMTCDRGGAVVWLARERALHAIPTFPATQHLRLSDQGLTLARAAA